MTNDGLVGFKHVGGSEGTQLVPDLATSLPTPTDGRQDVHVPAARGNPLLERVAR